MWNNSVVTHSLLNIRIGVCSAGNLIRRREKIHLDHSIEDGKRIKFDSLRIVNTISSLCAVYFVAKLALLVRVGRELEKYPAQSGDGSLKTRS